MDDDIIITTTTDNLTTGSIVFNETNNQCLIFDGAEWETISNIHNDWTQDHNQSKRHTVKTDIVFDNYSEDNSYDYMMGSNFHLVNPYIDYELAPLVKTILSKVINETIYFLAKVLKNNEEELQFQIFSKIKTICCYKEDIITEISLIEDEAIKAEFRVAVFNNL